MIVGCLGSEIINFFSKDTIIPTITLISPLSGSEDTDGIVDFGFNVTDSNNIVNCSLYLDNVLEQTDTSITKSIIQTFHVINIKKSDNLVWFVSCFDNFGNQGNSSKFILDTQVGGSGGGAGGGADFSYLNETICNLSYEFILKNDNYNDVNIANFYDDLTDKNISVDLIELKTKYIKPFQGSCSEVINRTLKPEFVCKSIEDFSINNNYTIQGNSLTILREDISSIIPITFNLLEYYINNFNDICSKFYKKPLSIALIKDKEISPYWIIFSFILIGITIFFIYKKKKTLLIFKESSD